MLIQDRNARARAATEMLWHGVLGYVIEAIQQGDVAPLLRIGLRTEQMGRLSSMSVADLTKAMLSDDGAIQLRVDPDRLETVMSTVERHRARTEIISRCIRMGAPAAMMRDLFAMREPEFRRQKALLGVRNRVGRPPVASSEIAAAIYLAWEEQGNRLSASALLHVADTTGVGLDTVWRELLAHPQLGQRTAQGTRLRMRTASPPEEVSAWTR